jgi:hypothetical protein
VEEQEGETKGDQRRGSRSATCVEGKNEGQDESQVGRVIPCDGDVTCRLRTLDGVDDLYSWNKDMLQKYFV